MEPTTAEQKMLLLDNEVKCQLAASASARLALQQIAAGNLDEAAADLRRALASVERGLLWKHQRDRLIH